MSALVVGAAKALSHHAVRLALSLSLPLAAVVPLTALLVHRAPVLPPANRLLIPALVALAGAAVLARVGRPGSRILSQAIALALCVAWLVVWRADAALQARLPPSLEGTDLLVVGHPVGLIRPFEHGIGFDFLIRSCKVASLPDDVESTEASNELARDWCAGLPRVRLSWYRSPRADQTPAPGERWQLRLRLKRVHGLINPGGFDSELRALEEGITARGYVRDSGRARSAGDRNARIDRGDGGMTSAIDTLRQRVGERMRQALADWPEATRGTLIALVNGDQSAIPPAAWQDFNRTGTSHLMSISGLHVTIFAALAMAGIRYLLRLPPVMPSQLLLRMPAPALVAAGGVAAALGYSLFSGWGIPAQRTSFMLAVGALAVHTGRSRRLIPIMALAAAVVTLLDPWAPMAAGFWLSFGAVAAIVGFGSGLRAGANPWYRDALRTQWAATIALLPLGAAWFGTVPVFGPLANAVAIPLISLVITPLAMISALLQALWPSVGDALLALIAWPTQVLLDALAWLGRRPAAVHVTGHPSGASLLAAVLGCALLLWPWRPVWPGIGVLLILPMLLLPADPLAPGQWRLLAIDVGQGNAVLVRTAHHALLVDTGPSQTDESGAGDRIVTPVLHGQGVARLDRVVLSHQDADHVGGARAVLTSFGVTRLLTSIPPSHPLVRDTPGVVRCERGLRWRWDGVDFEFLHPGPIELDRSAAQRKSNARSCVLRIHGPGGSALLAGDIERGQERLLGDLFGNAGLQADVLVAPHHGSKTSSTARWLDQVAPRWAIFQVGYRNRFGHPADPVLDRYRARGIGILRSDRDGAIDVHFAAGREPQIRRHRHLARAYWRIAMP